MMATADSSQRKLFLNQVDSVTCAMEDAAEYKTMCEQQVILMKIILKVGNLIGWVLKVKNAMLVLKILNVRWVLEAGNVILILKVENVGKDPGWVLTMPMIFCRVGNVG